MAARWIDDWGPEVNDDPPPLGRRAARRARAAARAAEAFDDAEIDQLLGDLELGDEDWFERRVAGAPAIRAPAPVPHAPRHLHAPRPHEPAAAGVRPAHQPTEHVRRANEELRLLHGLVRSVMEVDRDWDGNQIESDEYYEQPAECDLCWQTKPLRRFALAPCGHGVCRRCIKTWTERQKRVCPDDNLSCTKCRRPLDRYRKAKTWQKKEDLDRLLQSSAALFNPYVIM